MGFYRSSSVDSYKEDALVSCSTAAISQAANCSRRIDIQPAIGVHRHFHKAQIAARDFADSKRLLFLKRERKSSSEPEMRAFPIGFEEVQCHYARNLVRE